MAVTASHSRWGSRRSKGRYENVLSHLVEIVCSLFWTRMRLFACSTNCCLKILHQILHQILASWQCERPDVNWSNAPPSGSVRSLAFHSYCCETHQRCPCIPYEAGVAGGLDGGSDVATDIDILWEMTNVSWHSAADARQGKSHLPLLMENRQLVLLTSPGWYFHTRSHF